VLQGLASTQPLARLQSQQLSDKIQRLDRRRVAVILCDEFGKVAWREFLGARVLQGDAHFFPQLMGFLQVFSISDTEGHHLFRAEEPRKFVELVERIDSLHYWCPLEDLR